MSGQSEGEVGLQLEIQSISNVLCSSAEFVTWNDPNNWLIVAFTQQPTNSESAVEEDVIMLTEFDAIRGEWSGVCPKAGCKYTISRKSEENELEDAEFTSGQLEAVPHLFTLTRAQMGEIPQETCKLSSQVQEMCKSYKKVLLSALVSQQAVNFVCLGGEKIASKECTVLLGSIQVENALYSGAFQLVCCSSSEEEGRVTSEFRMKREFLHLKQWYRVKQEENALFDQANEFFDLLSANANRVKRILPVTKTKFNWIRAMSTCASLVNSKNASRCNIDEPIAVEEMENVS